MALRRSRKLDKPEVMTKKGDSATERDTDTPVSSDTDAPASRIVVGVDGSEQSKLALRWAKLFAGSIGATIDTVMAWRIPIAAVGLTAYPIEWRPDEDAEKVLNETVDEVFGHNRPADIRLLVREGDPAKVLLEASQGAQMLVVGSRGHGGFVGLLLGSVSGRCAEYAKCPVLVVHGQLPARG